MSTTIDKMKTRVVNLLDEPQYVFFIPPHGKTLDANATEELDWAGGLDAILSSGRMSQRRMSEQIQRKIEAKEIAIIPPVPTLLDVTTDTLKDIESDDGVLAGVTSAQEELNSPPAAAPTFGTVLATSVVVNWTRPAQNGSRPITGYSLEYKAHASPTWIPISKSGAATLTHTVTGLTTATNYDFRVKTVTDVGESTPTATAQQVTA